MAHSDADAQRQLLDVLAAATDAIGRALTDLGEAYEQLDERTADRLEEELYRPVQHAYGRAQRTHASFAARHDLPAHAFAPAPPGPVSTGAKRFIERAVEAIGEADAALADLQDSLAPIEYGDAELRAGLSEVRRLVGDLPGRARRLLSVLGR